MNRVAMLGLSALLVTNAHAGSTICKVSGDYMAPIAIAWDEESRTAKVEFVYAQPIAGRFVSRRPHGSYSKVNLRFTPDDTAISDEYEIIVFQTAPGIFRVSGVGFRHVDGERLLDITLGSSPAVCSSL